MGVWIETDVALYGLDRGMSHPVWVCGLKLMHMHHVILILKSHPVWVCGLKQDGTHLCALFHSHTLYGCVD